MSDDVHVSESAGAYVLGALAPEEAHASGGACRLHVRNAVRRSRNSSRSSLSFRLLLRRWSPQPISKHASSPRAKEKTKRTRFFVERW